MARRTTLEDVRNQLKKECRRSSATSRATDNDEYLDALIRRYAEQIYMDYDWPWARMHKEDGDKELAAGQRYYDFPTQLDVERTIKLYRKYGNTWTELPQGITPIDYSAHDSDVDERADPALKWDVYDERQFEIWPLPASNGDIVRWDGYRRMEALVDDTSRLDVDDMLVVLFAASEVLAGSNQKDAQLKAVAANRRLLRLTQHLATKTRVGFYPASTGHTPLRIRVPLVRY